VISLRSPGSFLDQQHPGAREGERLFRGSGTSQAAAVVSGAAALLLDQREGLTPDQVKTILTGSAQRLPEADVVAQGSGMLDLSKAGSLKTPRIKQPFPRATGLGSLQAARGSNTLNFGGVELAGEIDARGQVWNPAAWAAASATRTAWSGGSLTAKGWAGGNWNGTAWYPQSVKGALPEGGLEGLSWSGLSWSGLSWSGLSWSGLSWSGLSWSGLSWSGLSWSGLSWSGLSWSGLSWSGLSWSGLSWSGISWS